MKSPLSTLKDAAVPILIVLSLLVTIPIGYQLARQPSQAVTPTPEAQEPATPVAETVSADVAEPIQLPAGLSLVISESDPTFTTSTLWIASLPGMQDRQVIGSFQHREGYPPVGIVSPDGGQIAILNIPPDATESTARTDGGEIWVLNADGSSLRRLSAAAGSLAGWSPDGKNLTFSRLVPLENSSDPNVPFRTEILTIPLGGGAPVLIHSDESAYGVQPLGWDAGGQKFWVAQVDVTGQWSVLSKGPGLAVQSGALAIPGKPVVTHLELSPAGDQLLVNGVEGGQATLQILELDTGSASPVASAPADLDQPAPFSAVWASDGGLLVQEHSQAGSPGAIQALQADSQQLTPLSMPDSQNNPALTPIAWSPDQAWIVLVDYQADYLPLYLQNAGSGDILPIPRAAPDQYAGFVGWINR